MLPAYGQTDFKWEAQTLNSWSKPGFVSSPLFIRCVGSKESSWPIKRSMAKWQLSSPTTKDETGNPWRHLPPIWMGSPSPAKRYAQSPQKNAFLFFLYLLGYLGGIMDLQLHSSMLSQLRQMANWLAFMWHLLSLTNSSKHSATIVTFTHSHWFIHRW